MAAKKQQLFSVSVRLNVEIGVEVEATSLKEAVEKAEAWGVSDIVDFKANGWDHNDSEKPVITSVYRF